MVTVIIPAYNVENYIDRCLSSVVNQTILDLEIIIVDDGSTDNTSAKCIEWSKNDKRITYIKKKNEGQGIARNVGVSIAKYEYITFVDSDDWCDSEYVEKLYNAIKKHNTDISICDKYGVIIDGETGEINKHIIKHWVIPNKRLKVSDDHDLIYKLKYSLWAKMFRKSLFIDNNITQPAHKFENNTVIPLLIAKSSSICFINEPLYYYWLNRGESTVNNFESFLDMKKCLLATKNSFIENGIFDIYYNSLMRFSIGNIKHTLKKASSVKNGYSKDGYRQLENELYLFMKLHYPNVIDVENIKLLVWGSYNLRRVAFNIINSPYQVKKHLGFSNIISTMSNYEKINIDNIENRNPFRKEMLEYDFNKEFKKLSEKKFQDIDYILIDLLEERYDLIQVNKTFYTKSDAFDEISKELNLNYSILSKEDDRYWNIWQNKCLEFIDIIKSNFDNKKIILVRMFLSEYIGEYRKEVEFDNVQNIRKINLFLKRCYNFFQDNFSNIIIIYEKENENDFTDKDFIFGCYPWHFNDMKYNQIADEILEKMMIEN